MTVHPLADQFGDLYKEIPLGERSLVAIAAHTEVRSVLRASGDLKDLGLDDMLVGSYARRVMNWPGRDAPCWAAKCRGRRYRPPPSEVVRPLGCQVAVSVRHTDSRLEGSAGAAATILA